MILIGCLIAATAAVAPRVFLVLAWLVSDRWVRVWGGEFLVPLLGILFLPYTTIMYYLVWTPNGIEGFAWMWIVLGLVLDVTHWAHVIANRKPATALAERYYPSAASRSPVGGSADDRVDDAPKSE
jgi:hypothetical protein